MYKHKLNDKTRPCKSELQISVRTVASVSFSSHCENPAHDQYIKYKKT